MDQKKLHSFQCSCRIRCPKSVRWDFDYLVLSELTTWYCVANRSPHESDEIYIKWGFYFTLWDRIWTRTRQYLVPDRINVLNCPVPWNLIPSILNLLKLVYRSFIWFRRFWKPKLDFISSLERTRCKEWICMNEVSLHIALNVPNFLVQWCFHHSKSACSFRVNSPLKALSYIALNVWGPVGTLNFIKWTISYQIKTSLRVRRWILNSQVWLHIAAETLGLKEDLNLPWPSKYSEKEILKIRKYERIFRAVLIFNVPYQNWTFGLEVQ